MEKHLVATAHRAKLVGVVVFSDMFASAPGLETAVLPIEIFSLPSLVALIGAILLLFSKSTRGA